ncbi:MAG: DUF4826 family protein [Glaciecola sp.]
MTTEITNEAELNNWVRDQFQRANKYLAEQGILFESTVMTDSRYLAPHVAVWKIKDTRGKQHWVISGDVPADAVDASVANDARDALRHFSLRWQLKAENIAKTSAGDKFQIDYAKLLDEKAQVVYALHEKDDMWQS